MSTITSRTPFRLPLRLVASIVAIVAVAATAVGGTLAYFSGTLDRSATITTATIGVNSGTGFPLSYGGLVPGDTQSQNVQVVNTSSVPADLYVQLLGGVGGYDYCNTPPGNLLTIKIEDLDVGGNWYNGSICNLFPGWSGSTIVKVGDDVGAGVTKNYKIYLTLDPATGNGAQGQTNTDTVHLIAVQASGPAPIPDKQGGTAHDAWPADTHGADDDPNY